MLICPACRAVQNESARFCTNDGQRLVPLSGETHAAGMVARGLGAPVTSPQGARSAHDPFLGRTLASRYQLLRRLGQGATAYVYLARHALIGRTSAIKILRPELAGSTSHRERFLREARAVNRVHHPNIVQISDVGESDGLAYLVMEYIDGESLCARLLRGRPSVGESLATIAQVASALARAHELGVIHRDLKPENVLLTSFGPSSSQGASLEGSEDAELRLSTSEYRVRSSRTPGFSLWESVSAPLVKLTDFGIARLDDMPQLTTTDQLFGTPGYIAPEVLNGERATAATDIYALGVMLFESLAGRLPWTGMGQSQLLLAPLFSEPLSLSEVAPHVPSEIATFVGHLLAREPASRVSSAYQVYDTLISFLEQLVPDSKMASVRGVNALADPDAPPPTQHGRALLRSPEPTDDTGAGGPPKGYDDEEAPATIAEPVSSAFAAEANRPLLAALADPFFAGLGMPHRPTLGTDGASRVRGHRTGGGAFVPTDRVDEVFPSTPPGPANSLTGAAGNTFSFHREIDRLGAVLDVRASAPGFSEAAADGRAKLRAAHDMLPHLDRTVERVRESQSRVDALEREALGFRESLGRAIDALVRERTALRMRRETIDAECTIERAHGRSTASRLAEDEHLQARIADLEFQAESLARELDRRNDHIETSFVDAVGGLEGNLAALRVLTSELARILEHVSQSIDLGRKTLARI